MLNDDKIKGRKKELHKSKKEIYIYIYLDGWGKGLKLYE